MYCNETGQDRVAWIRLAQQRDQWQGLVNTIKANYSKYKQK